MRRKMEFQICSAKKRKARDPNDRLGYVAEWIADETKKGWKDVAILITLRSTIDIVVPSVECLAGTSYS